MTGFRTKRIYEPPSADDGLRVLVDRVWPRGLKKADVALDRWLRDVAPSSPLRRWFGHDPAKWQEFCRRYAAELEQHPDEVAFLRHAGDTQTVTLLFGARDERHNNAVALKAYLET